MRSLAGEPAGELGRAERHHRDTEQVCRDVPVSAEIAGSRMLTAEVLAFTTSVEMQVAASTPPARVVVAAVSLIPASLP